MTDKQYSKFLRDNVAPLSISKLHKSKIVSCVKGFLKPKDTYYTKSFDGVILEWIYMPCSPTYRKELNRLVDNGLIYVEKSEELTIFKHNESIQTELFDEKV